MRILDPRFKYTPSMSTNVMSTWKRFGYKPTTEAERMARQRRTLAENDGIAASVTRLDTTKRKRRNPLRLATRKFAGAAGE